MNPLTEDYYWMTNWQITLVNSMLKWSNSYSLAVYYTFFIYWYLKQLKWSKYFLDGKHSLFWLNTSNIYRSILLIYFNCVQSGQYTQTYTTPI